MVPHLPLPTLIIPPETFGIELLLRQAWPQRGDQQARFSSGYPCVYQEKTPRWTCSHTSQEVVLKTVTEEEM